MDYIADITIIGAGVVGLSVACNAARAKRKVYVLEKNETFGLEQSSRNSEVIHAGIYYEKDSLKARFCVEGNHLLYQLCEKNGIPYRKCGKVIVATNDFEAAEIDKFYTRGRENGAPLQMLSRQEMSRIEPNMAGITAFLSPSTGIVDSHYLMRYYLAQCVNNGVQVAYKTKVSGIAKINGGYEVRVQDSSGEFAFKTGILINCAGLYSEEVAAMAGVNTAEARYKLHWCKGEYYSVSAGNNKLINTLIYPVPTDISVGLHVCFDIDWRLRLGPYFYYVNELDYSVNDSKRGTFLRSSMLKALPFIKPEDIEPESSGIMAMLQGKGEKLQDFVIHHEEDRGLPGFINLVGIDSPGLTCSAVIGKHVRQMVDSIC
jgi:L-2-hydroxyglutarate oxidase LhgO